MERTDLLYSGLMFTAGMLSLWTALLLTAAFVFLAPAQRKSAPRAATISSSRDTAAYQDPYRDHGAQEATTSTSLSQASSQRSAPGRALRLI